ncbi:hypothetical protein HLI01_08270 [Rhizobium laguerreae]|uniref:hypothetical protein n=1 Tax=Rhizobium laguerreae TaxID=1076926 RepID=UPI0014788ECD|nr:hypothetical protein [Rhizobium laguerreae]NNH56803.1 hypothetical protein [Rhizobium laguerreae]
MKSTRVKREASCGSARITLASLYLEGWNEWSNQCIGDGESKSLEVGDGDLHRLAYPWVIRNGIRVGLELNPYRKIAVAPSSIVSQPQDIANGYECNSGEQRREAYGEFRECSGAGSAAA